MPEKSIDSASGPAPTANPAPDAPIHSTLVLPPGSLLGSYSSMPAAQYVWQTAPDGLENEARARAEAAAGDAHWRRLEFNRAWERFRQAVELSPGNEVYHFKLGMMAWKAGRTELAEQNMLDALRLSPNFAMAHGALGQWYLDFGNLELALRHSEAALRLDSRDVDYVVTRAAVLSADGQAAAARELIEPLVAAGASHPRLALLYARLGDPQRAVVEIERVLRVGVHRFLEPRLRFAAASLLDRLGRYDEAFIQARQANELVRRPFNPAAFGAAIDRKIAYFTLQRMRCLPKSTASGGRVAFIVGMPRSGTTLIEQVLASHPAVSGGGELPVLHELAQGLTRETWADGAAFPGCLDSLTVSAADRLAKRYLSAVGAAGDADALYVTDKAPLNGLHLGLAQLLLPDCRVIHCRRSPLDTCLSCYFTDFAAGNEFACDLEHLGAVFRHYQRLMAHWKQVLTVPILEVRYDDLVLGLEAQSRRMIEFLNLPWDPRCLKFHENPRRVHSASRDQVRQPIYLSSIGRWKNYQKHLTRLINALGSV